MKEEEKEEESRKFLVEKLEGIVGSFPEPVIMLDNVTPVQAQRKKQMAKILYRKCLSDISIMTTEMGKNPHIPTEKYADEVFTIWLKIYMIYNKRCSGIKNGLAPPNPCEQCPDAFTGKCDYED